MSQFVAEWLQMERSNHSRLLYQLKRELADARRVTPGITPSLPRIHENNHPAISDRSSTDDRSGERPVVRTPSPARQVMYR